MKYYVELSFELPTGWRIYYVGPAEESELDVIREAARKMKGFVSSQIFLGLPFESVATKVEDFWAEALTK